MANSKGYGSIQWDTSKGAGRWVGVIKHEGRRHKVAVTPDGTDARSKAAAKREARRRLDALISEMQHNPDRADGNTTLAQLLDQWAQKYLPGAKLTPRTLETHHWALGVLKDEIGGKRLKSLRPDDVEAAFTRLATTPSRGKANAGMSRGSLVKLRSVLNQALRWGERRGLVVKNVAPLVELPGDARPTKRGTALTVDQAQRLLDTSASDRLHAVWRVMVTLGLRPGEATGLHWEDVDFDAEVIHVNRSLKLVKGRPVIDGMLKTAKSRRSIGAPPAVMDALRAHRLRQKEERLQAGPLWSQEWPGLVFTTELGTPVELSNLRRSFNRVLDDAGLPRVRLYDLRHTATSIASAHGARLEEISDMLGHVDTRMAMRTYRHQLSPTAEAARRTMGMLR